MGKSIYLKKYRLLPTSLCSYDFIPDVLTRTVGEIDEWLKTNDEESFIAARRLIRSEGLLVGGSSGSALAGALKWLKSEEGSKRIASVEGANAVIILPDGQVHIPFSSLKC